MGEPFQIGYEWRVGPIYPETCPGNIDTKQTEGVRPFSRFFEKWLPAPMAPSECPLGCSLIQTYVPFR